MEQHWKTIRFGGRFSISLPADAKDVEAHGVDSQLFHWQGQGLDVLVDLGLFGDPLTSRPGISEIRVSDRMARLQSKTSTDGQYQLVVHVPAIEPDSPSPQKLTLSVTSSSQRPREDAQRIVESLKILDR